MRCFFLPLLRSSACPLLTCLVSTAAIAADLGTGGVRFTTSTFAADTRWEDGLAEVATYDLTQFRYNHLHTGGTLTTIVVRENLDPTLAVKADKVLADAVPVLKCHLVKSFATGVYRYEQASTVYLRRSDAVPLRLILGGHEWCGTMAKTWVNRGADAPLRTSSYFDGIGEQEQPFKVAADGVLADALWVWLRAWLGSTERPATVAVMPTQLDARLQSTVAVPATISAASSGDQIAVTVQGQGTWTYEAAAPWGLVSAQLADGSQWKRSTVRRFDYWAHHNPGDH